MTTYTPLPTGGTPALGTQGDAVKALQTQLNTQNAGVAGYKPLAVDGKYGPLTAAASTFKATPTIGQAYNIPGVQEDPALTTARTAADTFNLGKAAGGSGVDEGKIRADTLANFQAEIDATNGLYAEKLRQAKITGAGRLGSNTAIEARRGLLGSDFGNAQTDSVNKDNNSVYAGIDAEKNTAVSAILEKSRTVADAAIAAKSKAIGEGLDAHLTYLKDAGTRKATNATSAAQFIYDQKITPDALTPDQLKQTASNYGVNPEDIKASFIEVKKAGDAAKVKADQEAKKALPASAQEYEYAKSLGYKGSYTQYQNEDANRKALANRVPGTGTIAERDRAIVDKIGTLFSPGYTIPGSGGVPFLDGVHGYATPEGFKTALKASSLPRANFIKEFGYLVAPGLETNYAITPAEAKLITGVAPVAP